jgi:hypothetical protein
VVGDSGHKCALHELPDVLRRALQEPIKGDDKIKRKEYQDDFKPGAMGRFHFHRLSFSRGCSSRMDVQFLHGLSHKEEGYDENDRGQNKAHSDRIRESAIGKRLIVVIAVITDPEELRKILLHLVKIGLSPPGLDPNFV